MKMPSSKPTNCCMFIPFLSCWKMNIHLSLMSFTAFNRFCLYHCPVFSFIHLTINSETVPCCFQRKPSPKKMMHTSIFTSRIVCWGRCEENFLPCVYSLLCKFCSKVQTGLLMAFFQQWLKQRPDLWSKQLTTVQLTDSPTWPLRFFRLLQSCWSMLTLPNMSV